MIIEAITNACGAVTAIAALVICALDWWPHAPAALKPTLDKARLAKLEQESDRLFRWFDDASKRAHDNEMTMRMRAHGLKCSVVNGKVVRDRDLA